MSHRRAVRIMTYNVHRCVGIDRRHSPERIARVIERAAPDIIALQELEIGRAHQPELLARRLGMDVHYQPSRTMRGVALGNAILSRLPMRWIRGGLLPALPAPMATARGALWAEIRTPAGDLQFITTHLSLLTTERFLQLTSLGGRDWLVHPECAGPRVLAGDFNAPPGSLAEIPGGLREAHGRAGATWPSFCPFRRLDHVLASAELKVRHVRIPRTLLTRVASDHLPVVVDLEMPAA